MLTTSLQNIDGTVMLAVPSALLDLLHLEAGATVTLSVDQERLIMQATPSQTKHRYTLSDLLRASDYEHPLSAEEREWVDAPSMGKEII